MALQLVYFIVFFAVLVFVPVEACVKQRDCHPISSSHYCCRGKCITEEKEEECVTPKPSTSYIIVGTVLASFVIFVIIACFSCPRCRCYKCRRPAASEVTVTEVAAAESPAPELSVGLITEPWLSFLLVRYTPGLKYLRGMILNRLFRTFRLIQCQVPLGKTKTASKKATRRKPCHHTELRMRECLISTTGNNTIRKLSLHFWILKIIL